MTTSGVENPEDWFDGLYGDIIKMKGVITGYNSSNWGDEIYG